MSHHGSVSYSIKFTYDMSQSSCRFAGVLFDYCLKRRITLRSPLSNYQECIHESRRLR